MVVEDAGWCCKGYAPEFVFFSAPLEDGRLFAGDSDVFVIMDHRAFVSLVKIDDIPVVGESVWRAGVCSCVIGSISDAVVFATWPNATTTVLCDGPMIGRLLLGLWK